MKSSWNVKWNMQVIDEKQNQFFNGMKTKDLKYTTDGESRICKMIILNNIEGDDWHTVNPVLRNQANLMQQCFCIQPEEL